MKSASLIIAACMSMSAFAVQPGEPPDYFIATLEKATMYAAPVENRKYNDYVEKISGGVLRLKLLFIANPDGPWAGQRQTKDYLVRCATREYKYSDGPWEKIKVDDILGAMSDEVCITQQSLI